MNKTRRIIIFIFGLIVAFCEWGTTLIVPVALSALLTGEALTPSSRGAYFEFWVMFSLESLYILLVITLGLWAHTRIFFRLRWVFALILVLQGIDRLVDAINIPWMINYICKCFPLRLLGFVDAVLSFVLAYLIITTPGLTKGRGR